VKRPYLLPLNPLFAAAVATRNFCYDKGLLRVHHLTKPVISVGNLSTGGAGKTPFVLALAQLLDSMELKADVLTRGYGRSTHSTARVNPAGTSAEYGDEPLLLARHLPVFVGDSRYHAGLLTERLMGDRVDVHLLDDGLQHRQLARNIEVVLLHRDDFRDRLLPAGHLREPLPSLRRAHVLVLREEDANLAAQSRAAAAPAARHWRVCRALRFASVTGQPASPERPLAFCAIARPHDFFASLRAHGCSLVATEAFRDHHRYTAADVATLIRRAAAVGAMSFLTTTKDLCNLTPAELAELSAAAPVYIAELSVSFVNPEAVTSDLRELLRTS